MKRIRDLTRELHRRSIWQVLGVYVVGSWAVLSGVGTLGSALDLPDWFPRLALALLIIGLPVVLATAFLGGAGGDKGVPEGADLPTPISRRLFTWRHALGGGVLALALWGAAVAGWLLFGRGESEPLGGVIAVLPCDNAGGTDQGGFTVGIQDEIITQLHKISDLDVLSRSSTMRHQAGPERLSMPEIARQLGARWLVECGVQVAGDALRLNVQLIDPVTDTHGWAEVYSGDLSVQGLFAIQAQLAQRVAQSLSATITPEEAREFETFPTLDMDAYEAYLVGRLALDEASRDWGPPIESLRRAVSLDPGFGEAWAVLSNLLVREYWFSEDPEEEILRDAGAALDSARALAPESNETGIAEGRWAYSVDVDYPRARDVLTRQQAAHPNPSTLLLLSAVERRSGNIDRAIEILESIMEDEPSHGLAVATLAESYGRFQGRFDEAIRLWRRLVTLEPDDPLPVRGLVADLLSVGDTLGARTALESVPIEVLPSESYWRLVTMAYRGDMTGAIEAAPPGLLRARLLMSEGRANEARAEVLEFEGSRVEEEYEVLRLNAAGTASGLSPVVLAERLTTVARVFVMLGDEAAAIEALELSAQVLPMSRDHTDGPTYRVQEAEVYGFLGRADEAVRKLEEAIAAKPGERTAHDLRLSWHWRPIRDDPAFQALVARLEASG